LVSPIRGGALLLLKTGHFRDSSGQHYVTCRLDAFFRVDSFGADLLTRTLGPLVSDNADKNFAQAAMFLRNLCRAAEVDPEYMHRLSRKLTNVSQADRERFSELTAKIGQRAARGRIHKASHTQWTEGAPEEASEDSADVPTAIPPRR
jgi:hypothetical protein